MESFQKHESTFLTQIQFFEIILFDGKIMQCKVFYSKPKFV